jgi:MFS family permease
MITGCAAQYGVPYLLPALRGAGFSVTDAAALISAPILGVTSGLIARGAAADRWGERIVLVSGLAAAGLALAGAAAVDGLLGLWALLSSLGRRPPRSTPQAVASSSAGSRPRSAAWQWGSARPGSRSGSASPRWCCQRSRHRG